MRIDPFLENSQMVAPESPDMRHLPTIVEFPQLAITQSKTVEVIIRNRDLCRAKIDCMTVGIVSWACVIGATCSLAIRFDAIKGFFFSGSHSTGRGQKA